MKEITLSLALGTFGLGTAGFGIMGMLTELAHNVGISIPAVGHMISYYALEVVVGAPTTALFSSRYSLKYISLFLVALHITGNTMFTLFSSYLMLAINRLASDFPHGAFFSVGTIVLLKIIKPGRVTTTVAGMISRMTVANLLGIPLGTYLSQEFSWYYTFLLITVFNIVVMASIYFWVPDIHDGAKENLRGQFHLLRNPASWLTLVATIFGNASVFARFSYVKSYMVFTSGFSETAMTFIMMLVGPGMVLGNMLSGKISGRYSPLRTVAMTDFIIVLALLMFFSCGDMKATSLIFVFICCAGLLALSVPLQVLLLQNTKDGELLGAADGQIAFNPGSAIGAYCGSITLMLGLAYSYVTLPAALFSSAAVSSLLLYGHYKRQ